MCLTTLFKLAYFNHNELHLRLIEVCVNFDLDTHCYKYTYTQYVIDVHTPKHTFFILNTYLKYSYIIFFKNYQQFHEGIICLLLL